MFCPSDVEIWRPIPGYEGIYEASNQGRVRTSEGKTTYTERHGVRSWQQRIMKQKYAKRNGYGKLDARVCLWKDGKEKTFLVSRLVAMTFLPIPFDKLTVNHIDGDTTNNRIDNLEWCTIQENVQHSFRTGLHSHSQKAVVLTSTDGHELSFVSMAEASRYLKKSVGYVSNAIAKCDPCYDDCGVKYWARLAEDGGP